MIVMRESLSYRGFSAVPDVGQSSCTTGPYCWMWASDVPATVWDQHSYVSIPQSPLLVLWIVIILS